MVCVCRGGVNTLCKTDNCAFRGMCSCKMSSEGMFVIHFVSECVLCVSAGHAVGAVLGSNVAPATGEI